MVSQRDLAKTGPRGGSDSRDSGGLGSSSNPGRREPGRDRLQNQDRGGSGPLGRDPLEQSGGVGAEPTEPKGLMEALGDLDFPAADEAIQRAIAPGDPLPFNDPSRRPAPRLLNDERIPLLGRPRPPKEEELPIVPGDPDDLGARGRRRNTRDDVNASPVLRRGLLGV